MFTKGYVVEENDSILPDNDAKMLLQDLYLCKAPLQVLKYFVATKYPTTVTLVRNSYVLVME